MAGKTKTICVQKRTNKEFISAPGDKATNIIRKLINNKRRALKTKKQKNKKSVIETEIENETAAWLIDKCYHALINLTQFCTPRNPRPTLTIKKKLIL